MFFTPQALAANRALGGHWRELWSVRDQMNVQSDLMVNNYRTVMTPEQLAVNAIGGLSRDFWAELDRQVIQLRDQETGMEIVNDLMSLQTVLPVGKTAKLYSMVGNIAEDVSVSLDGQAPYSFDHTEYSQDGDPIPMFSAGYGVNWRHALGLQTVGLDLVLDSQQAKLREYNKRIVSYVLDGDARIQVESYPAQGLRNHRNTVKINLGSSGGGANIDLTTADAEDLLAFWGQSGAFGQLARENRVAQYDVVWVSYEIWANMARPYLISINGGSNAAMTGTVMQAIMPFTNVREFRPTYALTGNEFLGYVKRQDIVSPLVGMAVGITPLPRPLPQTNFNFQILSAMGIQVKRDADNRSGVVYGADLD